jgi:hypothetical protein
LQPDGSLRLLRTGNSPVVDIKKEGSYGVIEAIESPWNALRWVFLITGTDATGARAAETALDGGLDQGNVATIDPTGKVATLTIETTAKTAQARTGSSVPLYATAGTLAVIAGLLALIVYRWTRSGYAASQEGAGM